MLLLLTFLLAWPGWSSPPLQRTDPAPPALTPAPADSAARRPLPRARIRFYPEALWSSSSGFGLGFGLEVQHLFRPGALLLLTAAPAQHRGVYTASFLTADPFTAPFYGLLGAYYQTTGRYWYYGLGPASSRDNLIAVDKQWVELEARLGFHLFDRKVLLQPYVRMLHHTNRGFTEHRAGALERLSDASREHLFFVTDPGDVQQGFSYGLETALILRDRTVQTRRGLLLQATARRFDGRYDEAAAGPDRSLRFDTYTFSAYGFLPIFGPDHVLALRAISMLTRNEGPTPTPFYLLPTLDNKLAPGFGRYRFVGRDLLLVGAEFRAPLLRLLNILSLEGVATVNAGSVYDNLFEQFEPALTFERTLAPGRETYPLRPTLGVGTRLLSNFRAPLLITGVIGFSSEGLSAVTFEFVYDLRQIRPQVR